MAAHVLSSGPPADPEHMVVSRAVSVHQRLDENALLVPSSVEQNKLVLAERPTAAEVCTCGVNTCTHCLCV